MGLPGALFFLWMVGSFQCHKAPLFSPSETGRKNYHKYNCPLIYMLWSHEISSLVWKFLYIYILWLCPQTNWVLYGVFIPLRMTHHTSIHTYLTNWLCKIFHTWMYLRDTQNTQSTILLSHAPWACLLLFVFCMNEGWNPGPQAC